MACPKGKGGKKGCSGRPKLKFDLEEVRKVCALHPTDEELAAFLGCSVGTITALKKNDSTFLEAYEKGRGMGKLSLRRKQFAVANEGNVAMLIWLGKQHLGQADKQEMNSSVNQRTTMVVAPEQFASMEEWEAFCATQRK